MAYRRQDDSDSEPEVEQLELDEDDPMRQFLPQSFGQKETGRNIAPQHDKTRRPVSKEPKSKKPVDSDDDSDDDSMSDDEDEFPVTHELVLKDHTKAVTSVSLDPSGSRICTASHDSSLKLYDFSSMSLSHLHAFRSLEPCESQHLNSAWFSNDGQNILVLPANAQAKIISRDGEDIVEFVKGDPYLRDMNHTKGHVSEITSGTWHPTNKNLMATAGTDSTVRIWDINHKRQQKDVIVVMSRSARGGRTRAMCIRWDDPSVGGKKLLAAGAMDGSLTVWAGEGMPFTRPMATVYDAHEREIGISAVAFSNDGNLLVSRGLDGTVKSWDTRKLKTPIIERKDLPAVSLQSSLTFSPDSQHLLACDTTGNLHILSPATLRSELILPITPGHELISAIWHPKLNQILTSSSTGAVHVLYSPTTSHQGAILTLSRAAKRRHIDDDSSLTTDMTSQINPDSVLLPNAPQPTAKLRKQPNVGNATKPFKPHVTPFAKNNPDQDYIRKDIALSGMRDEDPREALLKYAEKAKNDPMFTGAWKDTQPKTIYDNREEEEAVKPEKKKFKKAF